MVAWEIRARCASGDIDPEWFFPNVNGTYGRARTVCADCPVAIECLNVALRERIATGMWGGHSPTERRRLARLARG